MNYNKLLFNILILLITTSMHLIIHTMGPSQVIPQIEVVEEATECSICLKICEENFMATFLKCEGCEGCSNGAHVFHTKCINQWFIVNQICPLCREEITIPAERVYNIEADIINRKLRQERRRLRAEHIRANEENRRLKEEIMRLEEVKRRAENEVDRKIREANSRANDEAYRRINEAYDEAYMEAKDQIMFELNQEQAMSRDRQKSAIGLGSMAGMLGGALFNNLGQTKSALIAKGALIGIPIAAFLYSFHKFPNNNTPKTVGTATGYALGFLASIFVVAIGNQLQSKQNEETALEYIEFLEQDVDTE